MVTSNESPNADPSFPALPPALNSVLPLLHSTLTLPVSKFVPTPVPSNLVPLTSILFDDHSGSRVRNLSPVFLCKDIS